MAADALRHAAEPPAPQVLQRRLPDQPNLEEGLLEDVRGTSNGNCRRVSRGGSCLIDEGATGHPWWALVPEPLLQLGQHGAQSVHLHRDIKTAGQQGEELPEGETRLPEHHRRELRRRDARQIRVHHRRFADPRDARDDHKTLAGGHPSRQGV